MAVRRRGLKRFLLRTLPVAATLAVLFASLVLISDVQTDGRGYGRHYLWVLILTGLALLGLVFAIVDRLTNLVQRIRSEAPGARLAGRWVRNFLTLSLPPVLIVYFFSVYFLTRTVDGWFDVQVETALSDSLQLGQQFLDIRTLEVRNQVQRFGQEMDVAGSSSDDVRRALLRRISASGPLELTVLTNSGGVFATASINALADLPERPHDYALLQARERGEYAAAEPDGDGNLRIRVIRQLPATPGYPDYLVQAIYPLPDSITALASSIEREYHRYQNVSYLRDTLKQSFMLILTLVLMLSVLMAMLAAVHAARRMVAPISRLAEATREVAGGDFEQAVKADSKDEIGFLVRSFNEMTDALKQASEEAESSRAALQAQGEYLETVLGNLSAGVLTVDSDGTVVTANATAGEILGVDLKPGQPLQALKASSPQLEPFSDTISKQITRGRSEWQREIRLEQTGAPLVLLMRGSRLPLSVDGQSGHVVVFDDVTILNQAQREAAWAEVARRLAHEVKNPLTPIRLAAERLGMKLKDKLEAKDEQLLDRATTTIVAQVEALRTLVDAFGDYASEPDIRLEPLRLDELIRNVVALYADTDRDLDISLHLCPGPEGFKADAGQLRQLLHNLIRNAGEARISDQPAGVKISSEMVESNDRLWLEMTIEDRGTGFPDAVLAKPFEPYVTHKPGGSGLGLAICRKIVVDHDGKITINNRDGGGARVRILLPSVKPPRQSNGTRDL
jgi:nitrogen fixation/metabolism regulation signal transduction histidine kinase